MIPLLILVGRAIAACETLIDDDLTDFATDGDVSGGSFSGSGWAPDGGTMVYNLPYGVDNGSFSVTLSGIEEDGLSQNDLAEMFTGYDGSFSDGETRSFLQLKMAGDVYDGYAGRIKMQIGGEYGDLELAEWSDERDWSPSATHTITVTWGDGYATMKHDGTVVAEVDYLAYNSGYVPFESLRIPNDGRYAYDPVADQLEYTHVTLCGEPEVVPAAPVVDSFDLQPRELAQADAMTLTWGVSGDVTTVQACGAARTTGEVVCGALTGASGTTTVGSEVLAVDTWDVWLAAEGAGGSAVSATLELVVHPAGWTADTSTDGGSATDTAGTGGDGGSPDSDGGEGDAGDGGVSSSVGGDPPGSMVPMERAACGCHQAEPGRVAPFGLVVGLALLALRRRKEARPSAL
jgi:hypothetical protein